MRRLRKRAGTNQAQHLSMFDGLVYDSSHITGAQIILSIVYERRERREEKKRNEKTRHDYLLGIKPTQENNFQTVKVNYNSGDLRNKMDNFSHSSHPNIDESLN